MVSWAVGSALKRTMVLGFMGSCSPSGANVFLFVPPSHTPVAQHQPFLVQWRRNPAGRTCLNSKASVCSLWRAGNASATLFPHSFLHHSPDMFRLSPSSLRKAFVTGACCVFSLL